MKYLLACPACGNKTPVETVQAGQTIHCTCGHKLDIPSVRTLRTFEAVGEEPPPASRWTTSQGAAFLGLALAAVAALAAAGIFIARPATLQDNDLAVKVDDDAVRREVAELSPADAFVRYDVFTSQIPVEFAERQKKKELQPFQLPSANLLAGYEDKGSVSLAPHSYSAAAKQALELRNNAVARAQTRGSLNDWLWLIAAIGGIGAAIAIVALVAKSNPPGNSRRVVAGSNLRSSSR